MIKIIHLGYIHKHGDTRIFEKECKTLAALEDTQVTYITSNRGGNCNDDSKDNIKKEILPLRNVRFIRLFIYLRDLKKRCIELDADIYHLHEPYLLPLVSKLKRRGKKVIYDKHESTFDDSKERLAKVLGKHLGTIVARAFNNYERKCIDKCDGYIYVTPQYKIDGVKCKSILVPNFPKLNEEDFKIAERRHRNNSKEIKLCYGGGIAPIWSLFEIVQVINEEGLENVRLEIAGSGTEAYIKQIKNADPKEKITYYGMVPFSRVKDIYKEGDIGMAILKKELGETTNDEGTLANTKIFEYMQQGLPVIFTNFPIWEKICSEYKFGIAVEPQDKEQLKNAIIYLSTHFEEAQRMGEEGKRAVMEKYNWQNSEKDFLELYCEVIGKVKNNE